MGLNSCLGSCTLRSFDFLLLIASVWNLLCLVFLYSHTLNTSIYILLCAFRATSEFSLGHAIFVIDQSLNLFVGLFVENFCRPTTSGLVFSVLSVLKTINYIINGDSFLFLANKTVNSEPFSPNVYIFLSKNISEFWGSLFYSI